MGEHGLMVYKYFVGIRPPRAHSLLIAHAMRLLGDPWPVPHITLKSPNGLTPDLDWLRRIRELAAQTPRFDVAIGSPRTFDDRVLYLAVEGAALESLHNYIAKIFSRVEVHEGGSSRARSFTPHLTLSVAREGHRLPPIGSWTLSLNGLESFEVAELTVFRREVSATHYDAWATLPLADRGA